MPALLNCLLAAAAAVPPTVTTSGGAVFGSALPRGSPDAEAVNQFLGLPFGAPTKRWEPPVDFAGSYGAAPLNATMWGAACLQVLTYNTTYGSEDCLKINVWQPASATPRTRKPVMVFIYGGSNQFGEAEPYNMSGLAAFHDVVAVNFNYRTGPIGWMAFESDVERGASTGNYGVLDIQSALRWVRREIGAFGGDAERVAIHGQSSGGGLVELQYVAPASNGLFRACISESGGLGASALQSSLANTRAMARATGCLRKDAATGKPRASKRCMQALAPLDVTSLTYQGSWGPTVDGVAIPHDPMAMLRRGEVNAVDAAVFGAQTNDSFLFLSRDYTRNGDVQPNGHADGDLMRLNTSVYTAALLEYVPSALAKAALALYPPLYPPPSNATAARDAIRNVQSLGRAESDQMHCAIRRRAKLFHAAGKGDGYAYRFNSWYRSNAQCTAVPNFHLDYLGAVHQDEVTFVMGQPNFMEAGSCCGRWGLDQGEESCAREPKCTRCYDPSKGEGYHAYFDPKEFAFARTVGGLWTAFAASGSPRRAWPDIRRGGVVLDADLQGGLAVEEEVYDNPNVCALWDAADAAR